MLGTSSLASRTLGTNPSAPSSPPSGSGDFRVSYNGSAVQTGTGIMPAGINLMQLGPGGLDSTNRWKIKRVQIYSGMLTDLELKEYSS